MVSHYALPIEYPLNRDYKSGCVFVYFYGSISLLANGSKNIESTKLY